MNKSIVLIRFFGLIIYYIWLVFEKYVVFGVEFIIFFFDNFVKINNFYCFIICYNFMVDIQKKRDYRKKQIIEKMEY